MSQATPIYRQGLRYLLDLAGRLDMDRPARTARQFREGGDFPESLIKLIEGFVDRLSKEELEVLSILVAVGLQPCPAIVVSRLPQQTLERFARGMLTRPAGGSVRISDIAWRKLGTVKNPSSEEALLALYRMEFGERPWWEIPHDGLLPNNLMRLLSGPERDQLASEASWWEMRIQDGGWAVIADLLMIGVVMEQGIGFADAVGPQLASLILELPPPPGPVGAALFEGARRIFNASKLREHVLIVGTPDAELLATVRYFGFDPIILAANSPEIAKALVSARFLITQKDPALALVRRSTEFSVPLFSIPFTSGCYGAESVRDIFLYQIQSLDSPVGPPPAWKDYLYRVDTYLRDPRTSATTKYPTDTYHQFPHFRAWAYYAGRSKAAGPLERTALLMCFADLFEPVPTRYVAPAALEAALEVVESEFEAARAVASITIWVIISTRDTRDRIISTRRRIPLIPADSSKANAWTRFAITVFNIAQQLNEVLGKEQPGRHRTSVITQIVRLMKARVGEGSIQIFRDFILSSDAGHRVWGYLGLGEKGTKGDIQAILDAAVVETEPSVQLQGLLSLAEVSAKLKSLPAGIFARLKSLAETLPTGSDRLAVIGRIMGTWSAEPRGLSSKVWKALFDTVTRMAKEDDFWLLDVERLRKQLGMRDRKELESVLTSLCKQRFIIVSKWIGGAFVSYPKPNVNDKEFFGPGRINIRFTETGLKRFRTVTKR